MGKVTCPVCKREVPRWFLRRGTFPCPWCKDPLRFPRMSRLQAAPIGLSGAFLAFLMLRKIGLAGNALLFATIIALAPAGLAAGAVVGAVWGWFFPITLERDLGDDGDILHVVPRGGPPNWRK